MNIRLSKTYNPLRQTSLIKPIVLRQIPSSELKSIYYEDQLTEYEFMILEFIGMTNVIKGGSSKMSFQGLKRLLGIHQAKLTKALNRLSQKELLEKDSVGYRLSDEGAMLFNKLFKRLNLTEGRMPETLFSHVAKGRIDGFYSSLVELRTTVAEGLIGRWFGSYRFTAKVDYEGMIELCWISTDGTSSLSFLIGPENTVRISFSSTSYTDAELELQVLVDRISNAVEEIIDLPIEITNMIVYENDEIII
ncbi:MAG: hypothetical protein INQ03_13105 [Candidatus Heimdallarchaeota archaeon]|nr:hypothetical protein [Candidatus Heimdallarchaeota archaeon]